MTSATFSDVEAVPGQMDLVDLDELDQGEPDDDPAGGAPAPGFDPAAPFGYFKSGRPRKSPPGSRAAKPGSRGPKVPGPPRKTGAPKAAPKASAPDYERATAQVLGTLQALLAGGAALTRQPALMADTATLVVLEPQLCQISAELADHQAGWATTLERLSTTSQWAPLLNVSVALVAQLAVNHGLMPAGAMGTETPEKQLDKMKTILAEREEQQRLDHEKRERARARAAAA